MIRTVNKSNYTFPELNKPLFQKCSTCKSELMIDNIWDITVHKITYADSCGNPCSQENLTITCPNCHYDVSLNSLNRHKYFKALKLGNIKPLWIEKYRFLTPLQKSIATSILEIKLFKNVKDRENALLTLSDNLFTLARFVRTFNFPNVKLINDEYDADFEKFCVAYNNGDITNSKEAYSYLIEIYNLKEYENEQT